MKNQYIALLVIFGLAGFVFFVYRPAMKSSSTNGVLNTISGTSLDNADLEYIDSAHDVQFTYTSSGIVTSGDSRAVLVIHDKTYPELLKASLDIQNDYEGYVWKGLGSDIFLFSKEKGVWRYYDSKNNGDLPTRFIGYTPERNSVYKLTAGDMGNYKTTYVIVEKPKNRVVTVEFEYTNENEKIFGETENFKNMIERLALSIK